MRLDPEPVVKALLDSAHRHLMDQPDVALKMRLIEAPPNQDEYAAAWNEVLAA